MVAMALGIFVARFFKTLDRFHKKQQHSIQPKIILLSIVSVAQLMRDIGLRQLGLHNYSTQIDS